MARVRLLGALLCAGLLLSAGVVATVAVPAGAATIITVTTNLDAGAGSLRQAFIDASSGGTAAGDDVQINIPASVGPITLTGGELAYDGGNGGGHALTLQGNGNTIDQTTANNRVIDDTAGTLLTVSGVTITGGHAPAGQAGGGILVQGALTVINAVVTNNSAPDSAGGVRVSNGNLILTNSTLSANTTPGSAGGGFVNGSATITNSTISGNTAGNNSGGLNVAGAITVTNSTISGNTGSSAGGFAGTGPMTLVYATVVGNGAGNLDGENSATLTSFASVIASPGGGGANCTGLTGTTSHGFNLEDDPGAVCGFSTGTGDLTPGTNPNLGALANNGGSTQTLLPQPGSALIDAVPLASCQADGAAGITTDQRGLSRPSGSGCDPGSVEVQFPVPASTPVAVTPRFTG